MSQRRAAGTKPPAVVAETPAVVVKAPLSLDKPTSQETVPLSTGSDLSTGKAAASSARVKHWKESPFACGLTEPTWQAERVAMARGSMDTDDTDDDYSVTKDTTGCLCCSAVVCSMVGAGRVGNMAVLSSTTEWVEFVEQDEETGEEKVSRYTRPKLHWIVGPL